MRRGGAGGQRRKDEGVRETITWREEAALVTREISEGLTLRFARKKERK